MTYAADQMRYQTMSCEGNSFRKPAVCDSFWLAGENIAREKMMNGYENDAEILVFVL